MSKTRTLAMLFALLGALPALSEPGRLKTPPPDNDRVPNKDPWQLYPRWTTAGVTFTVGSQTAGAREMALQSDGTLHFLLQAGGSTARDIYYSNNRPEGRTANGFSAPFPIKVGGIATVGDIAVGLDGRLTVAYLVLKTTDSFAHSWRDIHA